MKKNKKQTHLTDFIPEERLIDMNKVYTDEEIKIINKEFSKVGRITSYNSAEMSRTLFVSPEKAKELDEFLKRCS